MAIKVASAAMKRTLPPTAHQIHPGIEDFSCGSCTPWLSATCFSSRVGTLTLRAASSIKLTSDSPCGLGAGLAVWLGLVLESGPMLLAIGNDFDDVPPTPLRPDGPSTLLLPIPDVPVRLPPVMLLPRPLTLLPCGPSTPLPYLTCDCPGEPDWLLFVGPPLIVSCCRFETVSSATAGCSVVRRGGGGVVLPIVGP